MRGEKFTYMIDFWDKRKADLSTAVEYADRQIEGLTLRTLGQIAIPIEAAMEDENREVQ